MSGLDEIHKIEKIDNNIFLFQKDTIRFGFINHSSDSSSWLQ